MECQYHVVHIDAILNAINVGSHMIKERPSDKQSDRRLQVSDTLK